MGIFFDILHRLMVFLGNVHVRWVIEIDLLCSLFARNREKGRACDAVSLISDMSKGCDDLLCLPFATDSMYVCTRCRRCCCRLLP